VPAGGTGGGSPFPSPCGHENCKNIRKPFVNIRKVYVKGGCGVVRDARL
jgi:hypothetical protein